MIPVKCNGLIAILIILISGSLISFDRQSVQADEFDELDDAWYNSDELPNVDLEGLLANLTAQISWFKYVRDVVVECSDNAKEQDTLMTAIEVLHECLERYHRECASEYAVQAGCDGPFWASKPCGTFRFGVR